MAGQRTLDPLMVVRIHQGQLSQLAKLLQGIGLIDLASSKIEVSASGFVIAPLFPSLQYSAAWLTTPNGA
jgi:hypothetical protein